MPTAAELVIAAVKASTKTVDEKIVDLQKQIDELKEMIEKLKPVEEEKTGRDLIMCRRCGRNGHWTLGCKFATDMYGNKF